MIRFKPLLALGLLSWLMLPAGLAGQNASWQNTQLYATRAELETILAKYRDASRAQGYSEFVRSIAADEARLVEARLRDGDFEVGDQITMTVSGHPDLTNAFTVAAGRLLVLPDLGAVPLKGLLRSELPDSLHAFLSRYLREPQVYVETSLRIQVSGEVGNPGYHSVSADSRITDVLATVGQPTRSAKLEDLQIKRGKDVIWDGEELQAALVEGRTLDQLSMRAGDLIDVPGTRKRNLTSLIQNLYYLVPLTFAIARLF